MPHIDLVALAEAVGYAGLFAIIFAETGLLVGFFLPGDSLLMAVGLVASRGVMSLEVLLPLLILAALAGDATGYAIGRKAGPRLFTREDSRFFSQRRLLQAKAFYDRHGGKTIVLARFLAFARTFAPPVAGAVGMPYSRFTLFNVVGGAAWVSSMLLLGFWLGEAADRLPINPELAFLGVVGVIFAISVAPAAWHVWRERSTERDIAR